MKKITICVQPNCYNKPKEGSCFCRYHGGNMQTINNERHGSKSRNKRDLPAGRDNGYLKNMDFEMKINRTRSFTGDRFPGTVLTNIDMKKITIKKEKLEEMILQLVKETQDIEMFPGWKRWLCINEDGELFISDWWSTGTTAQNAEMLLGLEAWKTEDAVDMDEYYAEYPTKEKALEAAASEYYDHWDDPVDFYLPRVLANIEDANRMSRTDIEVSSNEGL